MPDSSVSHVYTRVLHILKIPDRARGSFPRRGPPLLGVARSGRRGRSRQRGRRGRVRRVSPPQGVVGEASTRLAIKQLGRTQRKRMVSLLSALRAFCTSMPRPLLCFRTPITEYASAIPHVSGIFTFSGMWPEILYFPDETRKMQDLRRVTGECSPSGSPGLSGSKKKGALRNFHPLCECEFRQITEISTFSGRIPEFTHSPADHRRMQPVRFVRFVRLEKEGETAELSHQGSGKVQSCVTAASPAAQIPQRSPLF